MFKSIYYIGCRTDLYKIHDTGLYIDVYIWKDWDEQYLYSISYDSVLNRYDILISEKAKEFHKLSCDEQKKRIWYELFRRHLEKEDFYA